MSTAVEWVEWSPPKTPHVRARYEVLPGVTQPSFRVRIVEAVCTRCGSAIRQPCTMNAPRTRIARFAASHAACAAALTPP